MQTFLPYPDFAATAAVLDNRRLGKQRVEGIQIVRALTVPGYAWKNHPAVLMWKGHEQALESYLVAICAEWGGRGFADSCSATIRADMAAFGVPPPQPQAELAAVRKLPPWLGDEELHRSHRGSLLLKDPDWYSKHFDPADGDGWSGYAWPVRAPGPGNRPAARPARPSPQRSRYTGRR